MFSLNLGCGSDQRHGFVDADIDFDSHPDIVLDLSRPLPFKPNTITSIVLQDVLEHLDPHCAQNLLDDCHRLLQFNGRLHLRVPHLSSIINQFSQDPQVMIEFLYGTPKPGSNWSAHRWGYTRKSLTNLLSRSGFLLASFKTATTNVIAIATKNTDLPRFKLLVIQQSPDWGGAEEWITSIVKTGTAKRIPVLAVTNYNKLESVWKKSAAETITLPFSLDIIGNWKGLLKSTLLLPFAVIWYTRLLFNAKRRGFNLILMSGFSEKLLVSWLALFFNLPVVWFEYGPLTQVFRKNFYLPKLFYRTLKFLPKRVITLTNHTKQSLITTARISLSKLVVIPPGVTIPPPAVPPAEPIVGSLSRLTVEKGQRLLLKSWPFVIQKIPQAKLIIAGSGPDLEYLNRIINKHNLRHSVKLTGFVTDKSGFYRKLRLFVFPTTWDMEGFGLVAAEAMSHALPVVGTNHGPVPEIVTPDTGVLVKPDAQALADAIVSLLKQPLLHQSLSRQARARARNHFNQINQANKVLRLCRHVLFEHSQQSNPSPK